MTLIARGLIVAALVAASAVAPTVYELLDEPRRFNVLPAETFETLGWDLPDGGRTVKAIADAAPGGAFDPSIRHDWSAPRDSVIAPAGMWCAIATTASIGTSPD